MSTYVESISLRGALERIKEPPAVADKHNVYSERCFEHHVCTWTLTTLKEVFASDKWAFTSEKRERDTGKIADIVVERARLAVQNNEHGESSAHTSNPRPAVCMEVHLVVELKKRDQRFEEALAQVIESVSKDVRKYNKGYDTAVFNIFIVVQAGLDIGFFELHLDHSDFQDDFKIQNFMGCTSLTQDNLIYKDELAILRDKPNDLKNLYYDTENLKKHTAIRDQAKNYRVPCIFNIEKHGKEVRALFKHMEKYMPRSYK